MTQMAKQSADLIDISRWSLGSLSTQVMIAAPCCQPRLLPMSSFTLQHCLTPTLPRLHPLSAKVTILKLETSLQAEGRSLLQFPQTWDPSNARSLLR